MKKIYSLGFNIMYPGYNFSCLERMKKSKIPMLYYKDDFSDL